MIDLHAHLLPAIDDGPATLADSLDMARAAVAAGTTVMACTPHVLEAPGDVVRAMEAGIARLRPELQKAGIPLEIVSGGEIAIPMVERMDDDLLRRASLGGGGWLLIEMPFRGWPLGLSDLLFDLEIRGFRALLAHPERAESVQLTPDRLREMVGRGALLQVTACSLTGENGPRPQRTADALLGQGVVHVLASDGHSAEWRPPGMAAGLEVAAWHLNRPVEEVRWMVDQGPQAILAGGPVRPPRLSPAPRRPGEARAAPPAGARSRRR